MQLILLSNNLPSFVCKMCNMIYIEQKKAVTGEKKKKKMTKEKKDTKCDRFNLHAVKSNENTKSESVIERKQWDPSDAVTLRG